LCGLCHYHSDGSAQILQSARQLGGLVRGDTAGDAEQNVSVGERRHRDRKSAVVSVNAATMLHSSGLATKKTLLR
jgi:hypothetical protein